MLVRINDDKALNLIESILSCGSSTARKLRNDQLCTFENDNVHLIGEW